MCEMLPSVISFPNMEFVCIGAYLILLVSDDTAGHAQFDVFHLSIFVDLLVDFIKTSNYFFPSQTLTNAMKFIAILFEFNQCIEGLFLAMG